MQMLKVEDVGHCELCVSKRNLEVHHIVPRLSEEEKKMQEQKRLDYDKAFEKLLEDGTLYKPPKDAIFDFVDAILDRKVNLSYNLFEQCKAVGEVTMVMLSVLYTNAKAVLQVQSCESKDISKSTGLTGWQIQNAKKHLDVYEDWELVDMLRLIHQCEKGIKTGKIDENYVMDYILGSIL